MIIIVNGPRCDNFPTDWDGKYKTNIFKLILVPNSQNIVVLLLFLNAFVDQLQSVMHMYN